jgi:UDP-N-acetyl-D-galactosamine dehydrogenase
MLRKGMQPGSSRVLIMGLAFKENCPDVRNSKVVDMIEELETYGTNIDVHDPWANADEAREEYGITLTEAPQAGAYDVIILAVAHDQFRKLGADGIRALGKPGALLYDIKYLLPAGSTDGRL